MRPLGKADHIDPINTLDHYIIDYIPYAVLHIPVITVISKGSLSPNVV